MPSRTGPDGEGAGRRRGLGKAAAGTEAYVRSVPSPDGTFPLPEAPWFPPDERVFVRRLCPHLIRETARHAGHADVIREPLDGKAVFEPVALARDG